MKKQEKKFLWLPRYIYGELKWLVTVYKTTQIDEMTIGEHRIIVLKERYSMEEDIDD